MKPTYHMIHIPMINKTIKPKDKTLDKLAKYLKQINDNTKQYLEIIEKERKGERKGEGGHNS